MNRKLLALVVTALLLAALAMVSPTQRASTLENAQIDNTHEVVTSGVRAPEGPIREGNRAKS